MTKQKLVKETLKLRRVVKKVERLAAKPPTMAGREVRRVMGNYISNERNKLKNIAIKTTNRQFKKYGVKQFSLNSIKDIKLMNRKQLKYVSNVAGEILGMKRKVRVEGLFPHTRYVNVKLKLPKYFSKRLQKMSLEERALMSMATKLKTMADAERQQGYELLEEYEDAKKLDSDINFLQAREKLMDFNKRRRGIRYPSVPTDVWGKSKDWPKRLIYNQRLINNFDKIKSNHKIDLGRIVTIKNKEVIEKVGQMRDREAFLSGIIDYAKRGKVKFNLTMKDVKMLKRPFNRPMELYYLEKNIELVKAISMLPRKGFVNARWTGIG